MDDKTFTKELEESLQKPEDWDLDFGYLVHPKTGIRMLGEAITAPIIGNSLRFERQVLVFNEDHVTLGSVPLHLANACYLAVSKRLSDEQESHNESLKVKFLKRFKGFK